MVPASKAGLAILLGTYNGEAYLKKQLESFADQTYTNWTLYASDDGSKDATLDILKAYQNRWGTGRLVIYSGPMMGFAANFLSLICRDDCEADYYAYADQDDIWEKDKLERGVNWLKSVRQDKPALYCSRSRLVEADNQEIGLSPLFARPGSFANALVQNIGSGNTMVFNEAARLLLKKAGADIKIVVHDWWTYLVVTGCGGLVFYDPYPSLRYRQHETNLIGMNMGWRARLKRLRMLWQGRFRHWNDLHIRALSGIKEDLTPHNRLILEGFSRCRDQGLIQRLLGFLRLGLYRQTWLGNLGLILGFVFKRM